MDGHDRYALIGKTSRTQEKADESRLQLYIRRERWLVGDSHSLEMPSSKLPKLKISAVP